MTGTQEGEVGELRAIIDRQQRELQMHRTELQQTNAGLLALHAEVELQRQRSAFLDEVSRTVSASLRGREVADALVHLVEREGVAKRAAVWLLDDEQRLHREPEPGEPDAEVRRVVANRRPVVLDKRMLVPLTVGPNLLGVLEVCREDTGFGDEDVPFVNAVAARSAVGLRNAGEYERERELAERLQLAMLPQAADHPAELLVSPRYRPAARGVNVGGDWYDAFTRPDGTVVLTVGDVTGHGLEAAVIMGKLQNALRAYAAEGHGPAETLRLTHALLRGWHSRLLATAVVLDLDLATGRVRWANAGHLPVFVGGEDGTVRTLDGPNAPLMGVPFAFDIQEHGATLARGETLLLYTDGLVERRTRSIDSGMERLARVFRDAGNADTEQVADHILTTMLGDNDHDDDVCLLVCRWLNS